MSDIPGRTQIPIVCPGHTRPLAELQYLSLPDEVEAGAGAGAGANSPPRRQVILLSACHDKLPMVRHGETGDWIGTFQGHKGAVWSCQMDPMGNLAATGSGDFSARLWDAITGTCLAVLPHSHIVKSVAFSPDSKLLATGGKEGLLRLYALTRKDIVSGMTATAAATNNNKSAADPVKIDTPSVTLPQEAPITKLAWVTSTRVLVGCANGKIYVWDVSISPTDTAASNTATTNCIATLDTQLSNAEIRDMEVSTPTPTPTTSNFVLTVAAGSKVFFFNLQTMALIHEYTMPIHFREEGGASLHPSGTKFVAGGSDLWVRVFDFATGTELECHKGHHGPIRCVRYSPQGGHMYATGSEDGTIRLWKTNPEDSLDTEENGAAGVLGHAETPLQQQQAVA